MMKQNQVCFKANMNRLYYSQTLPTTPAATIAYKYQGSNLYYK